MKFSMIKSVLVFLFITYLFSLQVYSQDGEVFGSGDNVVGQVGSNSTAYGISAPVKAIGLTNIKAIATGVRHSLAVKTDGTVWIWGSYFDSRYGLAADEFSLVPRQVIGISNVIAVAGGDYYSLALKADGTVWSWGAMNGDGVLGDRTTIAGQSPVQVSGITNIIAIDSGTYTNLALKSDGTVWFWGANTIGYVVNGMAPKNFLLPIQIKELS